MKIQSPHIDALANKGTVFSEAIVKYRSVEYLRTIDDRFISNKDRFITYYAKAQTDAAGIPDIPAWFKSMVTKRYPMERYIMTETTTQTLGIKFFRG